MNKESASASFSRFDLSRAIKIEGEKFEQSYIWLERSMPSLFFEKMSHENLMLITHSLMGFDLQGDFSTINRKNGALILCLDTPDADLKILQPFNDYGIKSYEVYVSTAPLPFGGIDDHLRITILDFTQACEASDRTLLAELKDRLCELKKENPSLTHDEFESCLNTFSLHFLLSLPLHRLALAIHFFCRAQTRDDCQCEIRFDGQCEKKDPPSVDIVLAWRNSPKHHFFYRLARIVCRYGLRIREMNAAYVDMDNGQSILMMTLSLNGSNREAAWDVAYIPDLWREIATFKYFESFDRIDEFLVNRRIVSGNMGNLLRAMVTFIHQALVYVEPNVYSIENIEEALCRHPELTSLLCDTFTQRFDPIQSNPDKFKESHALFLTDVDQLDTGHETNDARRKTILLQAMNFISHTLKTNFYLLNYTALSFRLDPAYLNHIPFDRSQKFPDLPFAIFFIQGMHFFAFHIRFKDLSRGGLRTIYPGNQEQMVAERNHVFSECYHLALTQHKKNKDIPEGGAKGVIFLLPFAQIDFESLILKNELQLCKIDPSEIEKRGQAYHQRQKKEYLYQSQRAFIESLMSIVNCERDGKLKNRLIIDYWKHPEYIYLGPDENMHDAMIEWIAAFSQQSDYKPGGAFISGKPKTGINHKEYGVTSLGINVYMERVLHYMGIDPHKEVFTVKMTGGPDGDVAGNQLVNLYRFYPHTAKVIALTDGTGTIRDDQGLDLSILEHLFIQGKGICFYPPEKLSNRGFLLNKRIIRHPSEYIQETLYLCKQENQIVERWLSGSETHHLLRLNVHQTKADIFIPAGGRPRTLNEENIDEFLDDKGLPTSRAIIEGANLYLNPKARQFLEEKGVLIIKDSSANKGGVICSSFEVLCGLALDDALFIQNKSRIVKEILERITLCASQEADLLLTTHQKTGEFLTSASDRISEQINHYTYQLLDDLTPLNLAKDSKDPLISSFLNYCLPLLREQFSVELMSEIPDHHKKAIISRKIASYMVYKKGVAWSPSIVDILPLVLSEMEFM
ncbi:MAG: NAD-glutamate dehydrogenase domain-containing protein [Parachlamydiaceae bacterium]